MPAGGSVNPPTANTVTAGDHRLDVPDPDGMKERLAPVSLPNYLDEFGHMQSVDQIVALEEGRRRGRFVSGDVVLFLAADTEYTWAATALEWAV